MSNSPADPPQGGERLRPWDAFRYRDYRILWGASVTTALVFWIRVLATSQWLFEETGSAAQLGFIGVVQLFVQFPALIYGGTLADHIDRKRLMFFASAIPLTTMLALGLMDASGALNIWIMYLAIAILAAAQMVAQPARSAMIPAVVPENRLMLAITTDTASQNAASIVGPLIFAVVAGMFGLTTTFFVAAVLSLPATAMPLMIRTLGRAVGGTGGSMITSTWEGFRFVVKHPILPGLFLLDTGNTVVSFYREILPVMASGLFRGGAGATGVLGAANSAGAMGGAFFALFLSGYRAKGMLVLYASMAYGVFLFGFGSVNTLWLGAVMIGLLGASDSVTVAVRQTTVQLTTPDHMRGRAYAFMIMAAQTANNVGTIWVGFWAAAIGAGNTMVLGGVISLVATVIIWRVWRPIREYRYP